ncbi:MAG: CPBP family intramembrane metalloprotease [Actinobacteria bacterium]|nr:MAG: CPBP family intramembrane metalloprotease [Actinomycetota bacterium]
MTEEAPPAALPRWALGAAAVGWVSGMVCGGVLLGLWVVATGQDSAALGSLGVAQVGFWVGLLGAVVVTSRRGGTGSVVRDFGLRFRPVDLPLGVGAGVATQLLVVPLIYFPFRSVIDRSDLERPARELADRAHGPGFLVFALVIAVGAPVVEELFYRGLLLRSLQRYLADGPAVVISGLVFAASHFELLQLPALALVGVFLAVLVVRTGRLGPAIWCHIAFNTVTVVALALER